MVALFLAGVVYAFAAAVQPGPLTAYLLSRALNHGWRRAVPAAFAPLLSDGPIAALVLLVLSQVPDRMVHLLQLGGGAFLLYLAAKAWRTRRRPEDESGARPSSGTRSLLEATLINLLNPNPYLGWSLVMGPLLIKGWHEGPAVAAALLVGFYGTLIATTVAIVLAFGLAGRIGPRAGRILAGLSAAGLACFGLFDLWLAVTALGTAP